MFWLKFLFAAVIVLIVTVAGIEFFFVNAHTVEVNYILGKVSIHLSWVMLFAFCAGVLLTIIVGAFVVLPLRWQVARLRHTVDSQEEEINTLAKQVRSARQR